MNLYVDHMWPYVDSPQIKSSLLRQHSEGYKNKSAKYYLEHLKEHIKSLDKKLIDSEAFIIDRIEELELYEVLLQDGTLIYIEFKDLDRKYNKGDLIPQKLLKYKK